MHFHLLHTTTARPELFTYPFCYTPHPLSLQAAKEVQVYIASVDDWQEEIAKGKMFGVLVVENRLGELGFLAAYSGILAGRNDWDYFVPAVYDLLRPNCYFQVHEAEISQLNEEVSYLERLPERIGLMNDLSQLQAEAEESIRAYRQQMQKAKKLRDIRRKIIPLPAEEAASLVQESQYMKAELRRKKKWYAERIVQIERALSVYNDRLQSLRQERRRKSDALQHWVFDQFVMWNARGEQRSLCEIFADTPQHVPPAGAGECCAPKLLQYAYQHQMHPVCMAEFWWGASPKTEIRHHLQYYPACRGKCLPILSFMLQGLSVEENPLDLPQLSSLGILYEDEWIAVIHKPAGMLSVQGKSQLSSVYSLMKEHCPNAEGPLIVHRLDMATSGILLIAKTKMSHQHLQAQFRNRTIRKRYIALLEGEIQVKQGTISLPIRPNPLNRPYQIVDKEHGKPAVTDYQILSVSEGLTKVALYPYTGRTHQLRIHCAHPEGLHCPIKGDELYGKKADRLYLHAECITFRHPITEKEMTFCVPAPF